jgi:pilus assembly protein Flp/PilA
LWNKHFGLDSSKFSQKILDRPLQISKLVVSGLRETANRRVIGRTGAELFKPWTFSPLGRSRRDERLDRLANLVDHPGELRPEGKCSFQDTRVGRFQVHARRRTNMLELIRRLAKEEDGQDLVEYALLLVFIALIVMAALPNLGKTVSNVFSNTTSVLQSGS